MTLIMTGHRLSYTNKIIYRPQMNILLGGFGSKTRVSCEILTL